ncbi:hypothetical protein BD309DRAFT_979418 [Dichomitus squalens]|nr:hypothetical protein BD309DRAFT_979418 [Dichomitus squalens]
MFSVFQSKRGTVAKAQKKFSTIASGIRQRPQSPPSPASFVSPEIVEILEKDPFSASYPEHRGPSTSIDRSLASPQIQLEFDPTESFTDWLSPTIAPPPENRTPPRRNVSLPSGVRPLPEPSSSSRGRGSPEAAIKEEPEPREPNRLFVDTSMHYAQGPEDTNEPSALPSTRKPTPSPIKIPNNLTSAKIRVQRSSTEEAVDINSDDVPPPLPSKSSRPHTPPSAITDDMSSAISGTSLARALVVNSFILSSEPRASKYKSGGGQQDSATLPRGEHPLNDSPYLHERRGSGGSLGTPRSSSVPSVPRLPSGMDNRRNSVSLILENGDKELFDPLPQLRRPKSTGRLRRERTLSMPPISPISEASSAPSLPTSPVIVGQLTSNASNRSLPQRSLDGNASSSSLSTGDGTAGHARTATEPASTGRTGTGNSASRSKGAALAPNGAMPGTMRSSGAFAMNNGRLAISRTVSETGVSRAGQPTRPSVLLPIGERPASVLVPASPQPSLLSNATAAGANPTPTSARFGAAPNNSSSNSVSNANSSSDTPVDSPDLLDNFPLQIAPQRPAGPPPPLPLGRRSEESNGSSAAPTPMHSSSGESMLSTALTDRQTFPETPNAFSPLWSASFQSPPAASPNQNQNQSSRASLDRTPARGAGASRAPGVLDILRMGRGAAPASRMSGSVFAKPGGARSSRGVPPTPPLTGESGGASQPGSPMGSAQSQSQKEQQQQPSSPALKRLTAIEEQVASRSVSTYSTVPEPPTSGAQFEEMFSIQQAQAKAQQSAPPLPLQTRARSGSNAAGRPRKGSVSQTQDQAQNQAQSTNPTTTAPSTITTSSAAEQAKAAEASSHRRMRSVANPDEPLASPPPSYVPTFDAAPPTPLLYSRANTADSSVPSRRSSLQSSGHLQAASSSQSSIPQKRSLSPFPSPPNSSAPSSPSPGRSRIDAHASSISVENPPPPYVEETRGATPPIPVPPVPPPPLIGPAPPARTSTPDLHPPPGTPRSAHGTPEVTPNKRYTRTRPPLPQGPRKPSYPSSAAAARMRAGSVSSLHHGGPSGSSSNSRIASMMSHAAPRFQPSRVQFRGLTMEAAQWTLTSQQLQHIVSTAIRQSADASAIRILPEDTLERGLPEEIERLEALAAELKLKYKLSVRKRNTLLANVSRIAESTESAESAAAVGRTMDELGDVTEGLDQTAEDLYTVTDQLAQLEHLRDVHQRSALAMALRKLNTSFLKQVGEVQRLREQVATLEAERDEAWREAQEVAQEFDDFTDRIMSDTIPTPGGANGKDKDKESLTPSRRSSRVMVARKNSQRASKAGLRSMNRRSQRSSTSSNHRYSGAASPGVWSVQGGGEDIPPVPPIPLRRSIYFPSGDLPTRSSMADSPSSDVRAMIQAQKELCEMLGISMDDIKVGHGPSRRQSMSAIPVPRSPASAAPTRRNSEIVTPNHQKSFKMMSKEI